MVTRVHPLLKRNAHNLGDLVDLGETWLRDKSAPELADVMPGNSTLSRPLNGGTTPARSVISVIAIQQTVECSGPVLHWRRFNNVASLSYNMLGIMYDVSHIL
jgi:hypothetical protein